MARRCTICRHPQRAAIELDLANGLSLRDTAKRHGVSSSAVFRHGKEHLGEGPGISAVIDEHRERIEVLEERACSQEELQERLTKLALQTAEELQRLKDVFRR